VLPNVFKGTVLYGVKILGKFNIERAGGKVWKLICMIYISFIIDLDFILFFL